MNFENLIGSNYAETITGDANANVLTGLGVADTINGLAGNDTLIADDTTDDGNRTTNDLLYGGPVMMRFTAVVATTLWMEVLAKTPSPRSVAVIRS